MNPTKSQLSFSSRISSKSELEADTTLASISEAASKLAAVIAHRIEMPKGKVDKQGRTQPEPLPDMVEVLPSRKTTAGQRRASLNARPDRVLTLWDRQDIFQEVNAFLWALAPDGRKLTYPELSELFQNCRRLLNMNGGNHDVERCDELDEAIHFAEIGSLASMERGSESRLALADKLKALRGWLWTAYASDTSRERRRNYSRHAETLRRIAAHANPFTRLTCPPIDPKKTDTQHESELGKRFTRFRLYASVPWKVKESDVSDLAEAMTVLA